MMQQERYVTITGFPHYYGKQPFAIGNLILCQKEPDNPHDQEAIRCVLPHIGTVGYVANSVHTQAGGTLSAGRIYEAVPGQFLVRVCFTTGSKIICRVEPDEEQTLFREFLFQGLDLDLSCLDMDLPPAPGQDEESWDEEDDGEGDISF